MAASGRHPRNLRKEASDTFSSLPGGRICSAAMTGESTEQEVDSRIGRSIADMPLTRKPGARGCDLGRPRGYNAAFPGMTQHRPEVTRDWPRTVRSIRRSTLANASETVAF